jgi:hypothetical protein
MEKECLQHCEKDDPPRRFRCDRSITLARDPCHFLMPQEGRK